MLATHWRTRCSAGGTKSGQKDPLNTHAMRERRGRPGRDVALAGGRHSRAERARALQGKARQRAVIAATWLELRTVAVPLSVKRWRDALGRGGSTHTAVAHAGGLCAC
jgi:hypothetical protein